MLGYQHSGDYVPTASWKLYQVLNRELTMVDEWQLGAYSSAAGSNPVIKHKARRRERQLRWLRKTETENT